MRGSSDAAAGRVGVVPFDRNDAKLRGAAGRMTPCPQAASPARRIVSLATGAGLLVAACGTDAPSGLPSSTVTDSAGIRVVTFHPSPPEAAGARSVDMDWTGGPALEFGELVDIDVFDDGRVALLDRMNARVTLLDAEGTVASTFGREGSGPGEFSPAGLSRLVLTDTSVLVPDLDQQRLSEFSLDGSFLGSRSFLGAAERPGELVYGVDWRAHPHGGIAFRVLGRPDDLLLRLHQGRIDTLHHFSMPPERPVNLLLPPTPLWDLDADGRLLLGRSDQPVTELREIGQEAPRWIARRGGAARPLSPEDRQHLEGLVLEGARARWVGQLPPEERRRIMESVRLPEHAPTLAAIHGSSDGRVWVQRAKPVPDMGLEALRVGSAEGFGGTEWEVLDGDGVLQEVVRLPDLFSARRFLASCIYGIQRDELDRQRPARVCRSP